MHPRDGDHAHSAPKRIQGVWRGVRPRDELNLHDGHCATHHHMDMSEHKRGLHDHALRGNRDVHHDVHALHGNHVRDNHDRNVRSQRLDDYMDLLCDKLGHSELQTRCSLFSKLPSSRQASMPFLVPLSIFQLSFLVILEVLVF